MSIVIAGSHLIVKLTCTVAVGALSAAGDHRSVRDWEVGRLGEVGARTASITLCGCGSCPPPHLRGEA